MIMMEWNPGKGKDKNPQLSMKEIQKQMQASTTS